MNKVKGDAVFYVGDVRCKNFFNKNTATLGATLNNDGTTSSNSSQAVSDFIAVEENQTYILSNFANSVLWSVTVYYDRNKNVISYSTSTFTPTTNISFIKRTPPANAKYIRFNLSRDAIDTTMFEIGDEPTEYVEYKDYGMVSGSNSLGNYIKYADGTLIQYGKVSITSSSTPSSAGGITYYVGTTNITYPIEFVDNNYIANIELEGANQNIFNCHSFNRASKSQGTITLLITNSDYSRNIEWMVVGRWK